MGGSLLLATLLAFVLDFSSCRRIRGTEAAFGTDGALVLSSSNGSIEGFDSAPASTHLQFGAHDDHDRHISGTAAGYLLPESDYEELEKQHATESASEQANPSSSPVTSITTSSTTRVGRSSAPKFAPPEVSTAVPSLHESNAVVQEAQQSVPNSVLTTSSSDNTPNGHPSVSVRVSADLVPRHETGATLVPFSGHSDNSNSVLTPHSATFGVPFTTASSTGSTAGLRDDPTSSSISYTTTTGSTSQQGHSQNSRTEEPAISGGASLFVPTSDPSVVLVGLNDTAQQTTPVLRNPLRHVSPPVRVPSTAEPSAPTAKPNVDAYVRPITQHSTDQFVPDRHRGDAEAYGAEDDFEPMGRGRCGKCQRKLHHCVQKCFQHHRCAVRPELSCPRIDAPCFPPFKYEADQCNSAADCGDANHLCCLVGCSRKCVVGVPVGP